MRRFHKDALHVRGLSYDSRERSFELNVDFCEFEFIPRLSAREHRVDVRHLGLGLFGHRDSRGACDFQSLQPRFGAVASFHFAKCIGNNSGSFCECLVGEPDHACIEDERQTGKGEKDDNLRFHRCPLKDRHPARFTKLVSEFHLPTDY